MARRSKQGPHGGQPTNDSSPPVLPLWCEKFLGSARVQALHGHARGIYALLLMLEWQFNGRGLPDDEGQLARAVGLEPVEFAPIWASLAQFFEQRGSKRLFNVRLERELAVAKQQRQRHRERSKRAAEARWRPHARSNAKGGA